MKYSVNSQEKRQYFKRYPRNNPVSFETVVLQPVVQVYENASLAFEVFIIPYLNVLDIPFTETQFLPSEIPA